MFSSSTAMVVADPPPEGQGSESLHDACDEDDEYEIEYEEVEEEIEVEEEVEVEEEESDDGDFLRELTPPLDHQKETSQSTEPDSNKECSGTVSGIQGDLVSDLGVEGDFGESNAKACEAADLYGLGQKEESQLEDTTSQVREPDSHKEHSGTSSVMQGYLESDLRAEGDVGESNAKDCGTTGLVQNEESQLDGKVIVRDLDCVPSLVDSKRRSSDGSVSGGELNGPIRNMDGSNKLAENDLCCEEESNQIAKKDSMLVASRVRLRSSTPSAEFGEGGKRPAIICDFFAKGWCIKGNSCRFLHFRDSVAVASQHRGEDVAQKGMELVDDEASSIPEICQPKAGESTGGKGEQEVLMDNDGSSMDLGSSSSGREFPKEDDCQYPASELKGHSIHGMYSRRPVLPEVHMSAEFSIHRSDFRMDSIPHYQNALVSKSSSYRRSLPPEFSSSNTNALASSPFPGYESENLSGSNIMVDTDRISGSRVKIPYDWVPSVPFSPSSHITKKILSTVGQQKLGTEQGSTPWLSKFSYSDKGASLLEAHVSADLALVGSLELDRCSNKYSVHSPLTHVDIGPKDFTEKDESMRGAELLKSADSHRQDKNSILNKEKLPIPTFSKYLLEVDKTGSNHEIGMTSKGPRYSTESKEVRSKQTIEVEADVKINGHVHKESKVFKHFHVALVEFVKELLKPIWHEGYLSKDAHKTIVKKIVDKVIVTLQPHQIPDTSESIKHYLSLSRPKLAKLVEGYYTKYRNHDMAA